MVIYAVFNNNNNNNNNNNVNCYFSRLFTANNKAVCMCDKE